MRTLLVALALTVAIVLRAWASPETLALVPRRTLPPAVVGDVVGGRVIVKFREGTRIRLRGYRFVTEGDDDLAPLVRVLATHPSVAAARLFWRAEGEYNFERSALEAYSGYELGDRNLYFALSIPVHADAARLVHTLNRLALVEQAYPAPAPQVPALTPDYLAPRTPDFTRGQIYLEPAPLGINARYAWRIPGGRGEGVKVTDIESGWPYPHEDLSRTQRATRIGFGPGGPIYTYHATAVMGEIMADPNEFGMTGIAPETEAGTGSWLFMDLATVIDIAGATSQPGDIILVEAHAPGPRFAFGRSGRRVYIAMEYWQDNFDAIRYATAKGVHVVAAAGNGGDDFDDPVYDGRFDPLVRDSGAILVGAAEPVTHRVLWFSCYGRRVNLHGYGTRVWTTGYGDLFNAGGDVRRYYTARFGGTSSASPIVVGAVAAAEGVWRWRKGFSMPPRLLRQVLEETGTPQAPDRRHIGPMPNLRDVLRLIVFNHSPKGLIVSPRTSIRARVGEPVQFVGDGRDPDGRVVRYLWDFGGGIARAEGAEPRPVRFPRPGLYRVALTVLDDRGLPDPWPDVRFIRVVAHDLNGQPPG